MTRDDLHAAECPMTERDPELRSKCTCDGYPPERREHLEGEPAFLQRRREVWARKAMLSPEYWDAVDFEERVVSALLHRAHPYVPRGRSVLCVGRIVEGRKVMEWVE